jgi:hypothetical protein
MQSSAMMAARAVILLVCLAAIPLLAIFGKDLPAVVKAYFHSYTTNPSQQASSSTQRTEPPIFRPGLLASKSADEGSPATALADTARVNAGVLPGQPLVPVATATHRVDSAMSSASVRNAPAQAMSASSTSAAAAFPPGYFREAEQRLRQLGATYYLLETLEPQISQYRFFCKVALGPKEGETLAFFATDRDPLAAMQQVVRQIEGWKTHAHQ